MTGVRRALETLVTGILRSRLGVALMLAVLILGVVGAARLLAGGGDGGIGRTGAPAEPITTVDPTAGDDGILSPEPVPSPKTSPGGITPDEVARRFAVAWLDADRPARQWHDALRPLSTPRLVENLAGVDPVTVPAERLTGDPVLVPRSADLVEVDIPVDAGTLRLELVAPEGSWLVDAVDWERG